MKIGTEDKKRLAILAVVGTLGLGSAFYIYYELAMPSTPAPVVAPVAATTPVPARARAKVSGGDPVLTQLDPTLKMGPMLVTEALVYSGAEGISSRRLRFRWLFRLRSLQRGRSPWWLRCMFRRDLLHLRRLT